MRKLTLMLYCMVLSMALSAQVPTLFAEDCINCDSGKHHSAIFEVRSNNQGILIPVLTSVEREAIQDPAEG